jgi:hypothetical protein
MDKITSGKKVAIIRGGNKKAPYTRTKKGDTLFFVNKNDGDYIECKATVKEVINTEKLTDEEALELILKYQNELYFTASQIKKWATKPYLTLIRFDDVEIIEPFKIDECSYINVDNWITIDKKLDN